MVRVILILCNKDYVDITFRSLLCLMLKADTSFIETAANRRDQKMTTNRPYEIITTVTVKNPDEAAKQMIRAGCTKRWLTVDGASYEVWDGTYGRVFTILTEFAPKVRGQRNGPLLITKVAEIKVGA